MAEDEAKPAANVVRAVADDVLGVEAAKAEAGLCLGGDAAAWAVWAGSGGARRGWTPLTMAAPRLLETVRVDAVNLGARAEAVVGRDPGGSRRSRAARRRRHRRRRTERNRGARNPRVRTRARGLSIRTLPALGVGAEARDVGRHGKGGGEGVGGLPDGREGSRRRRG
jgi:hypothetical protein